MYIQVRIWCIELLEKIDNWDIAESLKGLNKLQDSFLGAQIPLWLFIILVGIVLFYIWFINFFEES